MKKFIILVFAILTTSFLCAEQPFFLKNWIIPENVRWGSTDRIPEVEGAFIEQTESVTEPLTELTINSEDFYLIEVPPYFKEHKLLSWDMSYSDILAAFKNNKDFSVEERADYYTFNYFDFLPYLSSQDRSIAMDQAFDADDYIICNPYLNIFPKNYAGFYIQLTFASDSSPMDSFRVVYSMDDSTKPYKVLFEQNKRAKWEAMTETEKMAVALSAVLFDQYDLDPCIFDATPADGQKEGYVEKILDSYNLYSAEDIYDCVLEDQHYKGALERYQEFCGYLDYYPGKSTIEIAEEEKLSDDETASLIFIADMRAKIGSKGAKTLGEALKLVFLRLGAGAEYITHREAVELAEAVSQRLLKEYVSYEDYLAHLSLQYSYLGFENDEYLSLPKNILDAFDNIKKAIPVEEIAFDGSEADKGAVLGLDEAYYKPTKSHYNLLEAKKISKHGAKQEALITLHNCYSEYGRIKWLDSFYEKIIPEKYYSSRSTTAEEFFDENYASVWEKLPEMEQYAIAFSSNLFELNEYFQLDFTNNIYFEGRIPSKADRASTIKESWSIFSHDDLVGMIENLMEGLHSAAYKERLALLKKYPDKSPIEIGKEENLSGLAVTRLYFIQKMDDILGKHDIEAWDYGRALTLLRWGIFLGYTNYDEAMELSIPIVNKILDDYVSWEDFMAHYIAGRCFWGLGDTAYEKLAEASVKAAKTTRAYVPTETLIFTSENADTLHKMALEDCYYKPSEEALLWEKIQKLFQAEENETTLRELIKLEEENPEITSIVFYWHLRMMVNQQGCTEDTLNYIEENLEYVDSLSEDDEVYINSQYFYLVCLINTNRLEECINLYSLLPDSMKEYAEVKYLYAYSNLAISYNSNNPLLVTIYRRRAYEGFSELLNKGMQLDDFIIGWMEAYRNNTL